MQRTTIKKKKLQYGQQLPPLFPLSSDHTEQKHVGMVGVQQHGCQNFLHGNAASFFLWSLARIARSSFQDHIRYPSTVSPARTKSIPPPIYPPLFVSSISKVNSPTDAVLLHIFIQITHFKTSCGAEPVSSFRQANLTKTTILEMLKINVIDAARFLAVKRLFL